MDKQEANQLLDDQLAEYRHLSYSEFVAKLGNIDCREVVGPSGVEYQIEIQFMWDGKPDGALRVSAGIDDGGLSAFAPLCKDFIVTPDGEVVKE